MMAGLLSGFEERVFGNQSVYQPSNSSDNQDLGLGIMLGVPTGVTLKYWLSDIQALNFGLSYALGNYYALITDYLWHFPKAFQSTGLARIGHSLIPYVGVGAVLFVGAGSPSDPTWNAYHYPGGAPGSNGSAFGVRVPLGIEFIPKAVPLGIFAELDPGLTLISSTVAFVQGAVGARFYF